MSQYFACDMFNFPFSVNEFLFNSWKLINMFCDLFSTIHMKCVTWMCLFFENLSMFNRIKKVMKIFSIHACTHRHTKHKQNIALYLLSTFCLKTYRNKLIRPWINASNLAASKMTPPNHKLIPSNRKSTADSICIYISQTMIHQNKNVNKHEYKWLKIYWC